MKLGNPYNSAVVAAVIPPAAFESVLLIGVWLVCVWVYRNDAQNRLYVVFIRERKHG